MTYGSLREKIRAEKLERETRYAGFAALVDKAHAAGLIAADACVPAPMIVAQAADPLDDTSPIVAAYRVDSGVCGFAWIELANGRNSFAHWARRHGGFQASTYRGTYRNVSGYGQSVAKKYAYACAYADTLNKAGITAYALSRMD